MELQKLKNTSIQINYEIEEGQKQNYELENQKEVLEKIQIKVEAKEVEVQK